MNYNIMNLESICLSCTTMKLLFYSLEITNLSVIGGYTTTFFVAKCLVSFL